jgi:hypothetical protein
LGDHVIAGLGPAGEGEDDRERDQQRDREQPRAPEAARTADEAGEVVGIHGLLSVLEAELARGGIGSWW